MALSILHRITGVALSLGTLLLVAWFMALAAGPAHYARFAAFAATWPVRLVIGLWLVSFCYHTANGIRHLLWDIDVGMERPQARRSAKLVIAAAVLGSAVLLYLFFFRGSVA